jgi:glycosyltransferase involved in cell wall biosynthesis
VGSGANAPGYQMELETMAEARGLAEHVHMPGAVGTREGLGGYYGAADLFLCMSEHEGFCIPLIEAMEFDVPVVAYRSTGVPYAMGGAGVMVSAKRYDAIAELMGVLVRDEDRRRQVVTGQRRRLQALAADRVTDELRKCVGQMIAPSPAE